MAFGTDTENLQVDSPACFDQPFIVSRAGVQVLHVRLGQMGKRRVNIDILKQMVLHVMVIAAGVIRGQTDILIQIKTGDMRKRYRAMLIPLDPFAIKTKWSASRR